jgi:hypothetical protein
VTGTKIDATRQAMIDFLTEVMARDVLPDDLVEKALNLKIRCVESSRKGPGSQLTLLQQGHIYAFVGEKIELGHTLSRAAELAAKRYPVIGKRRIEQIYKSFNDFFESRRKPPPSG